MMQGLAEGARQSTALPVEIGFLVDHGYAPDTLREVALLAELTGVSADEFLLKNGLIGDREFYRALASELQLPFLTSPSLSPTARYPESLLAGVAPLAKIQAGFVMAPSGTSLVQLLKARRLPGHALAITTPSLLARAVLQTHERRIADQAAHGLPEKSPEHSIRDGTSPLQIAGSSCLALLLSSSSYLAPGLTLALSATILSPLFLGMIVLRLAASLLSHPVEPPRRHLPSDDAALPVYTVIVALYREKRVVSRLIAALASFDYPAAKLDIKLVLEADDQETLEALSALRLPGYIEVIVAPPGIPRTKPRALNVALPLARGRFTAIYDAEDVPDPGQLRLAVAAFSRLPPDVACLQARLTIDNTDDSWLTRLFTIVGVKQPIFDSCNSEFYEL